MDITIVTAFFDIGRGNLPKEKNQKVIPAYQSRTNDKYFEYFNNLAKIKNDMIIYTTKEFHGRILEARHKYNNFNTTVVILDSYVVDKNYYPKDNVDQIMNSHEFISKVKDPELIEYWNSDYVLLNLFKSFYVSDAIQKKIIKTNLVAWIDFGYCREENTIPFDVPWRYPFDFKKIHLFNLFDIKDDIDIASVVYSGDVYIQGSHIVANKEKFLMLKELMIKSFDYLINQNLSDDDQTVLLTTYLKNPELFELHSSSKDDWFRIFKDYQVESA